MGLVVSLSVSLVSPSRASRRHGDTASRLHGVAALPLCLSPSRTLAQSPLALGLTFLSSFFFSFFSFGFSVFAFSVWFWTAEAEIFSFIFIYLFFFLLWIDMGYGLMSSALGWPWPDDGLGEGGPEQKF